MIFDGAVAVGSLQVDVVSQVGYLAVIVAPDARRQGYATQILTDTRALPELRAVQTWVASIEATNNPSIQLFVAAGFTCASSEPDDDGLFEYRLSRSVS